MDRPSFQFEYPSWELFKFPPDPFPIALPPPVEARTFASPFPISSNIFNAALDWKVPVTIGIVYATSVILMNRANRNRAHKPWGISQTTAFHYFVLFHNIFLAVFSALTCFGMVRALAHTWPGRRDLTFFGSLWPGLRTSNGLVGATDALCKIHGPRNIGDAVFYNRHSHSWTSKSSSISLNGHGLPDTADVGRLWNEGLAFWGWWFYLSKFYEVLDTFIILAKGKRSSTLQTYHHTGAMACMWAGIRYMSPPIWMFVFINSGIHTLMYSYYTLAALKIHVSTKIKQTLTTMQITQFLVGFSYASLHLFVRYTVPVTTSSAISSAASVVTSAAVSAASAAASHIQSDGWDTWKDSFRKFIVAGIGEGVAVANIEKARQRVPEEPQILSRPATNETRTLLSKTTYEYISCLDTSGQAFAVYLNLLYLAPLTLLFARFFVNTYLNRGGTKKVSKSAANALKSAGDAAKDVERKIDSVGKAIENHVGHVVNGSNTSVKKSNNKSLNSKSTISSDDNWSVNPQSQQINSPNLTSFTQTAVATIDENNIMKDEITIERQERPKNDTAEVDEEKIQKETNVGVVVEEEDQDKVQIEIEADEAEQVEYIPVHSSTTEDDDTERSTYPESLISDNENSKSSRSSTNAEKGQEFKPDYVKSLAEEMKELSTPNPSDSKKIAENCSTSSLSTPHSVQSPVTPHNLSHASYSPPPSKIPKFTSNTFPKKSTRTPVSISTISMKPVSAPTTSTSLQLDNARRSMSANDNVSLTDALTDRVRHLNELTKKRRNTNE